MKTKLKLTRRDWFYFTAIKQCNLQTGKSLKKKEVRCSVTSNRGR